MEKIRKSQVIYLALQLNIFFQIHVTKKNVTHNGDTWRCVLIKYLPIFLYLREDAPTPNKSPQNTGLTDFMCTIVHQRN